MTLEAKFFSARLLGRGSVQTRPGCADQKGFLAALEMTDWSPLSARTKDLSLPISFSGIWQESDTQRISLNRSRASEVSVIPLWKRVAGRDFLLPCASIVPENSRFETKKLPHTTIKFAFDLPCQRRSGHRSQCTSPASCPDRIAKRAGFTHAPAFKNPFRAIAKAESLRGGRKISRDLEYPKTGFLLNGT